MKKTVDISKLPPDLQRVQRMSKVRNNRKCVAFNDMEMAAIEEYCRKFRITSMSTFFRDVIMEEIFSKLDESHPRLF